LQQYPTIIEFLNDKKIQIYEELADEKETALDQQKNAFMDMTQSKLVEGPLTDAIKIYYNHFSQIYFKKFPHDGDYVNFSITPGSRQTKNMLFAVFFRALKDMDRASQELATAEGKVTLRKLDGTSYEVDPKAKLTNLIEKPSAVIETAKGSVKSAISGIQQIIAAAKAAKKAVQSKDLKDADEAYTKAFAGLKTASDAAAKAVVEFRKTYAPFYPLTWDDGTSMTPGEFLVTNIAQLSNTDPNNISSTNVTLLSKVYNPFKKNIGLTESQLLGITQTNAIDTTVSKVVNTVKSVVSSQSIATPSPVVTQTPTVTPITTMPVTTSAITPVATTPTTPALTTPTIAPVTTMPMTTSVVTPVATTSTAPALTTPTIAPTTTQATQTPMQTPVATPLPATTPVAPTQAPTPTTTAPARDWEESGLANINVSE
jgi:hypothetical protein